MGTKDGEATGRFRSGLTTRSTSRSTGARKPLAILLTPGQAGDNPQLLPLLHTIRINGPGVARATQDPTRQALRRLGIRHTIPERADQIGRRAAKGRTGGRPPTFNTDVYKTRNVVERCVNRLNTGATYPPGTTRC